MENFSALIVFAFTMACTPGPNNVIATASGVNYGYMRTIPFIMGLTIGFPVMIAMVGFGLGFIFDAYPWLHTVMKVLGIAYLLWLAYKLATASSIGSNTDDKPLTFLQAAGFQWINPKSWAAGTSTLTTFTSSEAGNFHWQVVVVASVYIAAGFVSGSIWTLIGAGISRFLKNPKTLRVFNLSMAALLIGSLVMLFL
jgi:threonine/homoserine/homoserine lactone efflux protein